MTDTAHETRCFQNLASQIRAAKRHDPYLHQRTSESSVKWSVAQSAAWNALIYLREKKNEANPRAVQFLNNAIRNLTESQRKKLQNGIHAESESAHRESSHENAGIGNYATGHSHEPDIEIVVAGLCNLDSGQFGWLSIIIASQLVERSPLAAATHQQQIKIGGYVHKLIQERQKTRDGQRTRLRGNAPYESVIADAPEQFGCPASTLARAYTEFKWRRTAGMVDDNGNYIHVRHFGGD